MEQRSEPSRGISRHPVGKLRIHLRHQSPAAGAVRNAKVTLSIKGDGRPIYLTGTVAKEVRPGWVTMEIPPLEQWEDSLRWLTPTERERIESPEFFQMLQREIPNRLQKLPPPAAA